MITLEFRMDENALIEDKLSDPLHSDIAVLQETFFVLPVRFIVNGVNIFNFDTNQKVFLGLSNDKQLKSVDKMIKSIWLPLPVLNLAIVGLDKVKIACEGKASFYSLPETGAYIMFQPSSTGIGVKTSFASKFEETTCSDLLMAFSEFAEHVRKMILSVFPELITHPDLGSWLST